MVLLQYHLATMWKYSCMVCMYKDLAVQVQL